PEPAAEEVAAQAARGAAGAAAPGSAGGGGGRDVRGVPRQPPPEPVGPAAGAGGAAPAGAAVAAGAAAAAEAVAPRGAAGAGSLDRGGRRRGGRDELQRASAVRTACSGPPAATTCSDHLQRPPAPEAPRSGPPAARHRRRRLQRGGRGCRQRGPADPAAVLGRVPGGDVLLARVVGGLGAGASRAQARPSRAPQPARQRRERRLSSLRPPRRAAEEGLRWPPGAPPSCPPSARVGGADPLPDSVATASRAAPLGGRGPSACGGGAVSAAGAHARGAQPCERAAPARLTLRATAAPASHSGRARGAPPKAAGHANLEGCGNSDSWFRSCS
ncbi:unnamed protein product, partial [Prorocentrum cordatum]